MKNRIKYFLLCFSIVGSLFCFGQIRKIDSLLISLSTDKADTNKLIHLNKLSREYLSIGANDSSLFYANFSLELNNTIHSATKDSAISKIIQKLKAAAYNNIANVYASKGSYPEALKHYSVCLKIMGAIGNKKAEGYAYNNMGLIYYYQGNYPDALKCHFSALKIREVIGDKQGQADSYNNIGIIFYSQGNYPAALKNSNACLKICESIGYKEGVSATYTLLGGIYEAQGNYSEALKNHSASLKIEEAMGNKIGIARSYNNIGSVYLNQKNYPDALKNNFACLKIQEEIGNKSGAAPSCNNIGIIYTKLKQFNEAETYLIKARDLSKEIGYIQYLKDTYSSLTILDSARGNYRGAYENHKQYILYSDSLDNEETRKQTIQSQMTFDFEKKEAIANAEHKKELENQNVLAEEKSRKQKTVLSFVLGSLILVLVFAGFIFRSLRITRKQKHIIELQKNLVEKKKHEVEQQKILVEEHQREIIDSITYARRIQRSLLPTEKYIEKNLNRLMKN